MSIERFSAGTHDEGHLLRSHVETRTPDQFFEHAEGELRGMHETVMNQVIPNLEQYAGKWHPLGFMVWHLGVNEGGESLRLHVWPRGERKKSPVGPHIHNHAWYLSSLVLAGEYTDTFFDVIDRGVVPEYERKEAGFLRKYQLGYLPNGTDALVTYGECVSVNPNEERQVPTGAIHNIVDGRYHVPTIGEEKTVATLVLDSVELGYKTTVLIDSPPAARQDPRIHISAQEAVAAKSL
ncbi:hypothetical protein HYS00_02715, partial [Candidatus Microgenomates bacterium]|nr:hypothetical protein [Candidatus Microgenomates bacterium]